MGYFSRLSPHNSSLRPSTDHVLSNDPRRISFNCRRETMNVVVFFIGSVGRKIGGLVQSTISLSTTLNAA